MQRIRGTTSWRTLEITSEPYLVMTRSGYAGVVKAIDLPGKNEGELLVSGIQSLAKAVEPLRVANGGRFVGIRFRFKIEKGLFSSRYLVDQEGLEGLNGTLEEVRPTVTQDTTEKRQGENVNSNITMAFTKVLASPESGLFWCPRCHKRGRLLKPREIRLECLGCHLVFFVAKVSKAEEIQPEAMARAQTEYERGKAEVAIAQAEHESLKSTGQYLTSKNHSRGGPEQTLCEEQPQSVAFRRKGRESQSNDDKLWQHILRQDDHESADFHAKERNAETGQVISQNESSLHSSIEETPHLLKAEPRDEETSEATNRGKIKSSNAHGENFEANSDANPDADVKAGADPTSPNAISWSSWELPHELEYSLYEFGIHGPADLGILAALAYEEPPEPNREVNPSTLISRIQRHLIENHFVSDEAKFGLTFSISESSYIFKWEVLDGASRVSAVASIDASMCDDETSAATLVRDCPQHVTTGWVGNNLFMGRAYPNINDAVFEVLQTISERERDIISHRYGLDGYLPKTLEQIGSHFGLTRERIRQIQEKALRRLRHPTRWRKVKPLYIPLLSLAEQLGCDPESEDFAHAAGRRFALSYEISIGVLRLLASLSGRANKINTELVAEFDRLIFIALAQRYERQPVTEILKEILKHQSLADMMENGSQFDPVIRMRFVLGVSIDEHDMCWLDDEKSIGGTSLSGRDIRNTAMIRVLNRFGHPTHFEEIHRELEQELPEHLLLSIRNTSAWLDRNKELFAWAGPGTYGLTSWEMGHSTSTPSDPALRPARRRGIGDEIVNLLLTWGSPLSIREIKDHVLKRFVVKEDSVMASIRQDQAQRFTELPGDFVGLRARDGEEQLQSVASRRKDRQSQSNEDKLWQHILRRYDHESADFRANEWDDETRPVIPQNEPPSYGSIEETPLLLEAEPQDEETSEVTHRGRIKSPKAQASQQPEEGIPISRPEVSAVFLRYLNNTQQDISRGLLSGEKPISPVFVSHLLASGFRTEQISRMTYQEAYEFLGTTVPGQVPRLFSQNGSNPSNISTNESVQVDPPPDQGQVATITSDEARRRLIELRDTRLKRSYGDLAPEQGLLRRAMISAFLAYRPRSHEEFIARIPQSDRLNTDNRQIDEFLEEVLSILGLIEGE